MLEQKLNEFPVVFRLEGHSAIDGAVIPTGSSVAITSNDETVATVPGSVDVPDGAIVIDVPVTQLGTGSTDIHATITTPDGTVYEATDTLVLLPVTPGLVSISGTLVQLK